MAIELSTAEVASLKGCSTQYIRRLAKTEELKGHKCLNADGSPGWMFLVEELPTSLQEKYYNQLRASLPEASFPEEAKPKAAKPLDTYSIDEQEEIAFWLRLVKQWQGYYSTRKVTEQDVAKLFPKLAEEGRKKELTFLHGISQSKWGIRGAVNVYNNAVNNEDISYDGLYAMARTMGIGLV